MHSSVEILYYTLPDGTEPFIQWLNNLKDLNAKRLIIRRLARIAEGNMGDCQGVGEGVQELRIHSGPGYRIYFAQANNVIILLLCAGSKKTQQQDIQRAQKYWRQYQEEIHHAE